MEDIGGILYGTDDVRDPETVKACLYHLLKNEMEAALSKLRPLAMPADEVVEVAEAVLIHVAKFLSQAASEDHK